MKARLLITLLLSLLPTILLSQEKSYSKREIKDMVNSYISHLLDSVTIKGRLIRPIYKKDDPPITPLSNGIINVIHINEHKPYPKGIQLRDSTSLLTRSDKNGNFNFKLPRGRYILNFYYYGFDTENLLLNINIGEREIREEHIDLSDIRLIPHTIRIHFNDRVFHVSKQRLQREEERAERRKIRKEKRAKRAGKLYRKGNRKSK